MDSDLNEHLKTVPILLGRNLTIWILYVINTIALVILLIGIYINVLPFFSIILSIFFFYSMYYLYKGRTAKKIELLKYSYIMADSEFVLWPLILFIGKIIFTLV
jgi:4-hydroxybenzoate polyprenyltransferase